MQLIINIMIGLVSVLFILSRKNISPSARPEEINYMRADSYLSHFTAKERTHRYPLHRRLFWLHSWYERFGE
jgi:hypothetical protein